MSIAAGVVILRAWGGEPHYGSAFSEACLGSQRRGHQLADRRDAWDGATHGGCWRRGCGGPQDRTSDRRERAARRAHRAPEHGPARAARESAGASRQPAEVSQQANHSPRAPLARARASARREASRPNAQGRGSAAAEREARRGAAARRAQPPERSAGTQRLSGPAAKGGLLQPPLGARRAGRGRVRRWDKRHAAPRYARGTFTREARSAERPALAQSEDGSRIQLSVHTGHQSSKWSRSQKARAEKLHVGQVTV